MVFPQCRVFDSSRNIVDEFVAEGARTFDEVVAEVVHRFPAYGGDITRWSFKVQIDDYSTSKVTPSRTKDINEELQMEYESARFDVIINNMTVRLTPEQAFTDDVYTTKYVNNSIMLGYFIPQDVSSTPVDLLPIDLSLFLPTHRTKGLALMFALIYYELHIAKTTDLSPKTALDHVFRKGNITRQPTERPCINIISSPEQSGKTAMSVDVAVMALFIGKSPFISLRNVGGDTSMEGFRSKLNTYITALKKFLRDFGIPQEHLSAFGTIKMMTLSAFEKSGERSPTILFERTNAAQLKRVCKTILGVNGTQTENRIVFIKDEADEDFVSPSGATGATERAQFSTNYIEENSTLLQLGFMTFYVTATPQAIVLASATNVCNFEFTFTDVKPCQDYVGFNTPNRKVKITTVDTRVRINRDGSRTTQQVSLVVPPSLQRNFDTHALGVTAAMNIAASKWLHYDNHVLISIPDVAGNGNKSTMVGSVVSDFAQYPIVGFSSDCEDINKFRFNGAHFGLIDKESIKETMAKKHNVKCEITVQEDALSVKFLGLKTTQNLYDIAHYIYDFSELARNVNKFTVCVAYKHAGRSVSFKDSLHRSVLTTYYYGLPKTKAAKHLTNISQAMSRANSVDKKPFDRDLVTVKEAEERLMESLQYRREMANLIGDRRVNWDTIKTEINEDDTPVIAKYLGTTKRNATKAVLEEKARRDIVFQNNQRRAEAAAAALAASASVNQTMYRNIFERDLQNAAAGTAHMSSIHDKIEYWKNMVLEAEYYLGQPKAHPNQRSTWVTLCLLLVVRDGFRHSFTARDYDEVKDNYEVVSLVNLTRLSSSNGNGGHSWRSKSGTQHLVKDGNVYRLWV